MTQTVATYIPEEVIAWIDSMLGGEDSKQLCHNWCKNEDKVILHLNHHLKFDIGEVAMLFALKFHVYCALTLNKKIKTFYEMKTIWLSIVESVFKRLEEVYHGREKKDRFY